MTRPLIVSELLDTNGDGSGTTEATGDYSSAATPFYIEPPQGTDYVLTRLLVTIADATTVSADGYGAMAALTNGILVRQKDVDNNVLVNLTPSAILTNSDWATWCHDSQPITYGVGDNYVSVRWSFDKALPLHVKEGERLEVLLNDSFVGLTKHRFVVQGYAIDDKYQNYPLPIPRGY